MLICGLFLGGLLMCAGCTSSDQASAAETAGPEWNLTLKGACEDVISQSLYVDSVNCYHGDQWKDEDGNVWMGMGLWILVSDVDDIEGGHPTFNDTCAEAGYTITLLSEDGRSLSLESGDIARNRDYLLANSLNGEALTGEDAPLRLVGDGVSPEKSLGGIVAIELTGLDATDEDRH